MHKNKDPSTTIATKAKRQKTIQNPPEKGIQVGGEQDNIVSHTPNTNKEHLPKY